MQGVGAVVLVVGGPGHDRAHHPILAVFGHLYMNNPPGPSLLLRADTRRHCFRGRDSTLLSEHPGPFSRNARNTIDLRELICA